MIDKNTYAIFVPQWMQFDFHNYVNANIYAIQSHTYCNKFDVYLVLHIYSEK